MSKPMGAIPAGFAADADGMLLIGGRRADALVAEAGDTPLFVYDLDLVDARIARFRAAFPGVHLHYAIKANSYAPILSHIAKRVDGLDIASGGELGFALEAGADPADISFAGPGKRDADLEAAIGAGVTLNCESEGEAERALAIGARLGRSPRLAVRVNPDFEIKGSGMRMGGGAKPFGVDAARVPALVRRILDAGADWRGFHIFAGSQALDADALIEAQAATLALAAELAEAAGAAPPLVNLGGGFGIPHFHGEQPLDIEEVGDGAGGRRCASAPAILRETAIRDRARPLAGRRGRGLSDPDRRPQGQPRQDLPGHRRRHAAPARRLGQFRPGRPPQLSGGDRQPLRRRGRGGGQHRRLPVHAARPARR